MENLIQIEVVEGLNEFIDSFRIEGGYAPIEAFLERPRVDVSNEPRDGALLDCLEEAKRTTAIPTGGNFDERSFKNSCKLSST